LDTIRAMRVSGDRFPPAVCFLDCRPDLRVGVLLRARRDALREDSPGRKYLDEVRPVLEVGAHRLGDFLWAVRGVPNERDVDVDRELPRVAGPAGGGDVVAGGEHPWPWHCAVVNGAAQFNVDVGPGRPHVPYGGEAGQ